MSDPLLSPCCQARETILVNAKLRIPAEFLGNLTKVKLRDRDVEIEGVSEPRVNWRRCTKCRKTRTGMGQCLHRVIIQHGITISDAPCTLELFHEGDCKHEQQD